MFEGVKSTNPLLPLLEPAYVARRVVQAVRTDQEEVILPSSVKINYLFKFLLPTRIRDRILDFLGVSKSMDDFDGLRKVK